MMILRHGEHDLRFRQPRLHHHERAGGGKRKRHHARNLPGDHRAVGELDDDAVELLVELDIGGEIIVRHAVAADERIERGQTLPQVVQVGLRRTAFGRKPRRETLERAADLDRGVNVPLVEGIDDEPAGRNSLQQAFLLEPHQRRADGGTGDAEPFDQRELRHALAGLDLAAEDDVP